MHENEVHIGTTHFSTSCLSFITDTVLHARSPNYQRRGVGLLSFANRHRLTVNSPASERRRSPVARWELWHGPAMRCRIARWIERVLQGIDLLTGLFRFIGDESLGPLACLEYGMYLLRRNVKRNHEKYCPHDNSLLKKKESFQCLQLQLTLTESLLCQGQLITSNQTISVHGMRKCTL